MATAELTDDATHEDIEEFVDQVVKDKTDSQQLAEEHDEPAIAETDSGSEDTVSDGEEAGDSGDQTQDWFDDDLKAEVTAYGIDEEELADFTSREELERAMRLFDRSALEAGRKAMTESDKGEVQGKQKAEQGKLAKSEPKEGQYEIKLNGDLWDEDAANDLTGQFTKLRDHYESRFDALEDQFAEVTAKAQEQHFESIVDSLGHADLFGKTGKESPKQLKRRQDLAVTARAYQLGMQALGREVDLDKSLVTRAAQMVFADALNKKDLKARTRKVSRQSDGRMGGGATRASDPPETLRDEMHRKYKELDNA